MWETNLGYNPGIGGEKSATCSIYVGERFEWWVDEDMRGSDLDLFSATLLFYCF